MLSCFSLRTIDSLFDSGFGWYALNCCYIIGNSFSIFVNRTTMVEISIRSKPEMQFFKNCLITISTLQNEVLLITFFWLKVVTKSNWYSNSHRI